MYESCQRIARVYCQRLQACEPTGFAAQGFTTEDECVAKSYPFTDCNVFQTVTCTDFDWAASEACANSIQRASCDNWGAAYVCTHSLPKATPSTCSSSDGRVVCLGGNEGTCSTWMDECADGHKYEVSCDGSTCHCLVDDKETATFAATLSADATCHDVTTSTSSCGWNVLRTWPIY